MKRRLRKALLAVLILIFLGLLWIYRPYPSYDESRIAPELSSLREPFQHVEGIFFMDGGSVGVQIIDADGVDQRFAIPHWTLSSSGNPQQLYIGALHANREGAREIEYTEETRIRLAEILRNAEGHDRFRDVTIGHLSVHWRDYATILIRRFVTRVY